MSSFIKISCKVLEIWDLTNLPMLAKRLLVYDIRDDYCQRPLHTYIFINPRSRVALHPSWYFGVIYMSITQ